MVVIVNKYGSLERGLGVPPLTSPELCDLTLGFPLLNALGTHGHG